MQGGYGSGSERIGHGIEGESGLEMVGSTRDVYATGSGIGGEGKKKQDIKTSKPYLLF